MKKTKMLRLISLLLCLLVLVSCETDGGGNKTTETTNTDVSPTTELVLIANGQARCNIVRPKGSTKELMALCSDIADTIQQSKEIVVEVLADTKQSPDGFVEILIGDTNRAESSQAKEKLGDFEYSISVINGKVVVAASDDVMLENAIREFISMINSSSEQSEKGHWTIPLNYSQTFDGAGDYAYNAYIGKGYELTSEYTKIDKMSPTQNGPASNGMFFRHAQGGCTDGTYYYLLMCTGVEAKPEKCRILKYDLATQTRVQVSEEMELDHANDAAYNPKTNTILVLGCTSTYYVIDPVTLTIIKEVQMVSDSWGLSYDVDHDMYIVATSWMLYYYDAEFNLKKQLPIEGLLSDFDDNATTGAQGIMSDGKYIYFLEYSLDKSTGKNVVRCNIAVYDFSSCKFIERIPLYMGCEVENIGIWNNSFYIVCNNKTWTGAETYQVKVIPKF